LKQPALAVALWLYRFESRGLYSCCDAFSAERLLRDISGVSGGNRWASPKSRKPIIECVMTGACRGASKAPILRTQVSLRTYQRPRGPSIKKPGHLCWWPGSFCWEHCGDLTCSGRSL